VEIVGSIFCRGRTVKASRDRPPLTSDAALLARMMACFSQPIVGST